GACLRTSSCAKPWPMAALMAAHSAQRSCAKRWGANGWKTLKNITTCWRAAATWISGRPSIYRFWPVMIPSSNG
ncbi:MAG: hypothetical protein KDE54_28500, partial [Caldilineaceae bacterium]|nr:hypothetical protein [Caldilineaceae bacterium]